MIITARNRFLPKNLSYVNDAMGKLAIESGGRIPYGAVLVAPIFSLRTKESDGIGDFFDVLKLAEWGKTCCGISRILTLPNTPRSSFDASDSSYAAVSLEGLDPVYIRLSEVPEVVRSSNAMRVLSQNQREINLLNGTGRVDYPSVRRIKEAVLAAAFDDFFSLMQSDPQNERVRSFRGFCDSNKWVEEYAPFMVLLEHFNGELWSNWSPNEYQNPNSDETKKLLEEKRNIRRKLFHIFTQWEADDQWSYVINACFEKFGVRIIDDLAYLPSLQSHDVFYHKDYYFLDKEAGILPDQKWGNPPRDPEMVYRNPNLLIRPLIVAKARGIKGVRIDHLLGYFNPCIIPRDWHPSSGSWQFGDGETSYSRDRYLHFGRFTLNQILRAGLEVCAENLGRTFFGIDPTLYDMGISGMIVFRWARRWGEYGDPFVNPFDHGALNWISPSNHDIPTLAEHLRNLIDPEATVYSRDQKDKLWGEKHALTKFLGWNELHRYVSDELYGLVMERIAQSSAYQMMLPLGDAVVFDPDLRRIAHTMQINIPGTVNTWDRKLNWTWVCPEFDEIIGGRTRRSLFISNWIKDLLIRSGRADFR